MAGTVINLTHKPRPAFDVYIGRAQFSGEEFFEPSPWANPFSSKKFGRQEAIRRYEERLRNTPELLDRLPPSWRGRCLRAGAPLDLATATSFCG